jgi:hypothetical protein
MNDKIFIRVCNYVVCTYLIQNTITYIASSCLYVHNSHFIVYMHTKYIVTNCNKSMLLPDSYLFQKIYCYTKIHFITSCFVNSTLTYLQVKLIFILKHCYDISALHSNIQRIFNSCNKFQDVLK